jgi:hypothetical protein
MAGKRAKEDSLSLTMLFMKDSSIRESSMERAPSSIQMG